MKLNTSEVLSAASVLDEASSHLKISNSITNFTAGLPYSAVSGFDQAGEMHQAISGVSQPEATRGLAMFLSNASGLLREQVDGFVSADGGIADTFRSPGTGSVGAVQTTTPEQPKINPFNVVTPTAGRPLGLEQLVAQLAATDVPTMTGISANWTTTASAIAEAFALVPEAMGLLAGSAETESVGHAMKHIDMIRMLATQYAAHSQILGTQTAGLVTLTEASGIQAAAVLGIVRAAVDPIVSKGLEEAYLSAYGPQLTAELLPTVPTFNQLLREMNSVNGGLMDEGDTGSRIPEFVKQALPKVVSQALTDAGWKDLAHASTPAEIVEQVGRPNPEMLDLITSGATPTQVASAMAPTLPPAGALGGAPMAGGLGGAGGVGGAGLVSPAGGVSGVGGGFGSPGAAGSFGGFGGPMPFAGRGGGGFRGGAGFGGSAGFGGGAGFGAGAVPGALPSGGTGVGAGAGTGTGAGAGSGGVVAGGSGAGPRAGGAMVGAGGAHGGGYGVGPAASAGRGGQQKRGRVQAVTSAVEREGNLKALLGEAPEVVPGVIGAWVREPRR